MGKSKVLDIQDAVVTGSTALLRFVIAVISIRRWMGLVIAAFVAVTVGLGLFMFLQYHATGSIGYDSIITTIVINAVFCTFITTVTFVFMYALIFRLIRLMSINKKTAS